MNEHKLKDFLDRKVEEYNRPSFIDADPVSIPHRFSKKQDIEIAGFFAAIFAWGARPTIIRKCTELMHMMDDAPYDFCLHAGRKELESVVHFKHRTFNATDLLYFIEFFRQHYHSHHTLEAAFVAGKDVSDVETALVNFHHYFFSLDHVPYRTRKHIATPERNSGCKRLNMYLRWMVRDDKKGVDFGIWKKLRPSQLICPLDVHVARVADRLHLLKSNKADWRSALELTHQLRRFDPADPVKYDFALFGLGVMEKYR